MEFRFEAALPEQAVVVEAEREIPQLLCGDSSTLKRRRRINKPCGYKALAHSFRLPSVGRFETTRIFPGERAGWLLIGILYFCAKLEFLTIIDLYKDWMYST